MRVLIVEDDTYKAKKIAEFLDRLLPGSEVVVAKSVTSGLVTLFQTPPNVLLLDMSLSTYDVGPREPGGRPQNFGGITVLEQILRHQLDVRVIVITQFESFSRGNEEVSLKKLRKELEQRFGPIFGDLVYYNSAEIEWERKLTEFFVQGGANGKRFNS